MHIIATTQSQQLKQLFNDMINYLEQVGPHAEVKSRVQPRRRRNAKSSQMGATVREIVLLKLVSFYNLNNDQSDISTAG